MNKKIILLIGGFVFISLLSFFSCETCGNTHLKFQVENLKINLFSFSIDTDDSKTIQLDKIKDTMAYNNYAIQFEYEFVENYSYHKPLNFNFFNPAMACTPVEIKFFDLPESIDSIVISSNKDYNESYLAGTNLVDLFDVYVPSDCNKNCSYASSSVPFYFYNANKYSLNKYLETRPKIVDNITLVLNEQPDKTTDFQFQIKYYQNGIRYDKFELTTDKIVIKGKS